MVVLPLPLLFADAASSLSSFPGDLVNFGLGGIVILAIIFGLLWAKPAVDQLRADKDAVTKQRDDLMETLTSEVLPVLRSVTSEVLPALTAAKAELRDAGLALDRQTAELRRLSETVAAIKTQRGRT